MRYFKNVELANLYTVSEGTVRRWINAAQSGKLDLQLYEHNSKWHVANTTKNTQLIEDLVAKGKKHSNTRWHRMVEPTSDFYKLYNKRQIADIITNIDIHREIPLQYDYFGDGAKWWDKYAHRLWNEEEENSLTAATELLRANFDNLRRAVEQYEHVNVVDLCLGNALPVKELLTHLLYDEGTLARYIGIDISKQMLGISQKNIDKWFEGKVRTEGHIRDITYERFDDLLIDEDPETTVNVVLLLGGTLQNFRSQDEVLNTIHNSVGRNAIFITSTKLDTPESRRYFDAVIEPELPRLILGLDRLLETIGIEPSFYDVEQGYDETKHMRYNRVRFKFDITIKFNLDGKERLVLIRRGETLLLWRYWHHNVHEYINLLDSHGFTLLDASLTNDQQFILTVSHIDGIGELSR